MRDLNLRPTADRAKLEPGVDAVAGVSYELLPDAQTESALAEAQALGVSPDDVAKTLIVKTPEG